MSYEKHYTYVLQSTVDQSFVIGCDEKIEHIEAQHNYSKSKQSPFNLVYYEVCLSEKDAKHRMAFFKTPQGNQFLQNRLRSFLKEQPLAANPAEDKKKVHLTYIKKKGKFTPQCNLSTFTEQEIELLEEYGHWFNALCTGELEPFNEPQQQFVAMAKRDRQPKTDYEKVWHHYLKRLEIEAKAGDSLYTPPTLKDDTFYSRDMAKNMRKTMFSIISQTHKS
jgi:uncharacterized protein YifE (UPF0438 family)/predicted GIY-YIG superfamily endonuclease